MKLKLLDECTFQFKNNKLTIVTNEIYSIEGLKANPSELLQDLENGIDDFVVEQKYHNLLDLVSFLKEEGLIVLDHRKSLTNNRFDRILYYLENYSFDSEKHLEKLASKKVLILGLGGTGSIIFQHLVHNGVKNFTLVDCASVDLPDLNRQYIYSLESIGNSKTEEAVKYGKRINKNIEIETKNIKVVDLNSLKTLRKGCFDLVINAIDTPADFLNILSDFITFENYPFYNAGVAINSGQYGPLFIPHSTLCPNCFDKINEQRMSSEEIEARNIVFNPPKGSIGPTNSIIGSLASLECLRYLAEINSSTGRRQSYFDFDSHVINFTESEGLCNCWSQR